MLVVSDSTPLMHLSAVSDLLLLQQLFGTVTIPHAVFHEVLTAGAGWPGANEISAAIGTWLLVRPPTTDPRRMEIMQRQRLHIGEVETILLAQTAVADVVLLDEQRAVEFARTQGLTVFRSGTIFLAAKRAGFIPAVRPRLEALREAGFWIKASDYQAVLRMCGEAQ